MADLREKNVIIVRKKKEKKEKKKKKKKTKGKKYNAVRVNEINKNKNKKKRKKDRKIKRRKERKKTLTFQGTLLLFFFFLYFSFYQANLQRLLRASFLRNLIRICRYQKTTPRNAPGLPVYQQLHAKTFTLIGRHTAPLVLQSRRQGAFVGLLAWLPGCLLAYLLGFFVGRGFRTLRVRWVEAGLALVAVRYPGPLHVVLQSFEGKHELQFLHLVQHPQWIEIRPVHWLVHLRAATVEKII